MDLVLGTVILVLATPLLLLLAAAVRLSGPGPVFFHQERIGLDGRPFTLWKLRTMRVGAQDELARWRAERRSIGEVGTLFKLVDDPRVTSVGRMLRRTSLDELPQVLNVVMGQMSLVGPRPALPEEVARYTPGERRRLAVRPGLTGLWQVSGRSDLSWEQSVALDLRYVEDADVRMDLVILVRTVPAVLLGRGAY